MKTFSMSYMRKVRLQLLEIFSSNLNRFLGGFERWFNLTVVNISEEDADDYTCVGVNAGIKISDNHKNVLYGKRKININFLGGVSEQNVSLTFDQPKECHKIYLYCS